MDSAVDTVVTELARTNTARPVARLAADLRNVWRTVSRSLSDENRALIQHASQVRRTLFPVQTAIFDTLARVGQESMQGSQGPRARLNVGDFVRQQTIPQGPLETAQETPLNVHEPPGWRLDDPIWNSDVPVGGFSFRRIVDGNGNEVLRTEVTSINQEGTADSWRTQMSIDDVSGDQGWLEEAKKDVNEQYGVASDTKMPDDVANLKDSLCRAKKACNEEEQRVSQLQAVLLEAKTAMDKTKKVLQINDKVRESVDAPGQAVLAAFTALASKADQEATEAVQRLTKNKRALYVLQQAWQSLIGGGASLVPLCCICLTDGVDTVLHPCGHTFCHGCAKACQSRGKCPNCRTAVGILQKLFFS